MRWTEVFVGLGGNIGNSRSVLQAALKKIALHPEIKDLKISRFYQTSPVGGVPQNSFVNAVCSFSTLLCPYSLMEALQKIETELGKTPKPKNAPRVIDLDILFYGDKKIQEVTLEIPHPQWKERLFVLVPLMDLTAELNVPVCEGVKKINLSELLNSFLNFQCETVSLISESA